MNVNPNYPEINVAADLRSDASVFRFYQALIRMRRENPVLVYGDYSPVMEEDESIIAYRREYRGAEMVVIA